MSDSVNTEFEDLFGYQLRWATFDQLIHHDIELELSLHICVSKTIFIFFDEGISIILIWASWAIRGIIVDTFIWLIASV